MTQPITMWHGRGIHSMECCPVITATIQYYYQFLFDQSNLSVLCLPSEAKTPKRKRKMETVKKTSGYATWFTAGGAIHIAHYDVIDNVITGKL